MDIRQLILLAAKSSIFLMVLSVGLRVAPGDLISLLRQPKRLLAGLIAIDVVMPVVSILLIAFMPLTVPSKIALGLMALSPMAPIFPGKALKHGGHADYVAGLFFVVVVLSAITVTLWVEVHTLFFPIDAHVSPLPVAKLVGVSALIPLLAGVALSHFLPASVALSRPINLIGNIVLLGVMAALLATAWRPMLAYVGNGTLLAMATTVAAGLIAGHMLGGPDLADRATLATAAAARHPGIAAIVAQQVFPEQQALPGIVVFLLVGLAFSIPYDLWMRRRLAAMAPA